MSNIIWTPKLVEERLAEAAAVLRRLPDVQARGYFNTWPDYLYEFSASSARNHGRHRCHHPRPQPSAVWRRRSAGRLALIPSTVESRGCVPMTRHGRRSAGRSACNVPPPPSAGSTRFYAITVKLNHQPMPKNRSRRYVIDRMRDLAREMSPTLIGSNGVGSRTAAVLRAPSES